MRKKYSFYSPFINFIREFRCVVRELLKNIHILFEVLCFFLSMCFSLQMQRPKLCINVKGLRLQMCVVCSLPKNYKDLDFVFVKDLGLGFQKGFCQIT
jgi:hypothetical protein